MVDGGWRQDGMMDADGGGAGAALGISDGKHAAALTLRPLARLATRPSQCELRALSAGDIPHRDPRVPSVCFCERASLVASELTHSSLSTRHFNSVVLSVTTYRTFFAHRFHVQIVLVLCCRVFFQPFF